MKFLYRLFRQDPDSREGVIAVTSGLGILVNLLIAGTKVIIGILTSSIAIVSEGANNASDALTAVITLVGTKLSSKHPDKEHPFGYGRIEYLTSLVIAVLILVTGVEMLTGSIDGIIHPVELKVSVGSLIIIAVSAVVKYLLGAYTKKVGKKVGSGALVGTGADSMNDSFASLITIAASLVFLIFHKSLDAYAGIITSLLILKAGYEVLKETVSELLGRPGEKELAAQLYKEIRAEDGIINAADMMLHNYGPDRYSGSVNVEIDHEKIVGDVYQFLHALQLRIMHEYKVTMVFGIYAVDNDHEESKKIRTDVAAYVRGHEHVRSFHALYLEEETDNIYCDLVVDYELKDWDGLRTDFLGYMKEKYPENEVVLTIETEFV